MEESKSIATSGKSGRSPSSDDERNRGGATEADRGGSAVAGSNVADESLQGGESDEDDIITLGPGWMNRSGSKSLSLSGRALGSPVGTLASSGSKLAFCYTKEEVLALHSGGDECPPDFLALPYILSEDPLHPVNLSQDLLKDFEELQRKYLYNICPSRGTSTSRGGRGRGRGRGRGSEREVRPRDKETSLSGSSSGSGVYRPPRGRGRLGYSWEGEGERRPAWADTPIDKDAPKGRFRGGRFRGDSDSEGSASEPEDEVVSDEVESDGEDSIGWLYKDPQNIIRGPFSNKEMHEWYLGEFFPPTLPVKREHDADFKPLASYEGNPFAPQRRKRERRAVRKEKLREAHAASESEGGRGERGGAKGGDWGERDWRKGRAAADQQRQQSSAGASGEREKAASKKAEEPKDEANWRLDNSKDFKVAVQAADKKPAAAAPAPREAAAKKAPAEKRTETAEATKADPQAKKEKEEMESMATRKKEAAARGSREGVKQHQQQPQAGSAKPKPAGAAAGRRSAVDASDPDSLDDVLDHLPHLSAEYAVSSDDEGDERATPAPFPAAGARPAPLSGGTWPTGKAPWSAQELEMRQLQHFGGPGGPGVDKAAAMLGNPPAHHLHPHPAFPGGAPGGPMQPPHHPMMGPGGQPPPQFFAGLQPPFAPHPGHPLRQGVPAGSPGPLPHMPSLERRQGVFDMAAIEEQLMKQSHMPQAEMLQRMHMQQPHMQPHGPHVPPPHTAPWLLGMHGKPGHSPSLREIQEQEIRERQQRQHPGMPPQAFPHQFPPEQMLHHHQMMSEQHKQQQMHPLMRQQMAMGLRPPQMDPVFQSVWGISPDGTPLSLQEIQVRMQAEHEEEEERRRRAAAAAASSNESVEQELHDDGENDERQHQHQHQHHHDHQEEANGNDSEAAHGDEHGSRHATEAKETNDEEGIWDMPATAAAPAPAQEADTSAKQQQQQQQQAGKKQTKQQQQQKKKGNDRPQQQQQQKQKGGAKPPSLKEIQEQELLERQKQKKQQQQQQKQAQQAQPGDGKNLQHLLSTWGFSSTDGDSAGSGSSSDAVPVGQLPSWGSMEETQSLREIQEQEAAQREMAQMEDQQRRRQQKAAAAAAAAAAEAPWTGKAGEKKPTLSEIQAEELKQQQKRQKEMQHHHKQQLKAMLEQNARSNSPWAGQARAQASESSGTLSLREIQELEQQRKAQEEAMRRKRHPAGPSSGESITKLLWETRMGGSEPIPLSEIMAQEEAAMQSDEPAKPRKEAPAPVSDTNRSEEVWPAAGAGHHTAVSSPQPKVSLRDIQQEEQKVGKGQQQPQQQQQQQQKKGGKGQQQPSTPGQQEKSGGKKQSPQGKGKKQPQQQQQQQQQQQYRGVWGAVPSAPKSSLLDIQENQQRVMSPPPTSAPVAASPAPKSAPAPAPASAAVEDDFWGESLTAPKTGGKGSADSSAPAVIDESHFPALGGAPKPGGGANNAGRKGQQSAAKKAAGPTNWAQKTTGATSASAASSGGGRKQASSNQQQAKPAAAARNGQPAAAKPQQQQTAAAKGGAAAASKKKMQKLDPSLLGFSSNLHDRIAQGQVLPVDE